jgi:HAD superfamily hydrolase (TIGR01509 family)
MIVAMQLPAAVVFDFDGIILDSETPEFEAHRRLFELCGRSLMREEWCDQIGVWVEGQAERWYDRLRGLPGAPESLEAFQIERRRLFQELVSREPMRGIIGLLDALTASAVPLGVASTSPARWVVPALERIGLRGRFAAVVTADDVSRRKPAPDVYLEATRRLAADPQRSIAIEDSGPGVAAARAAGMKTVAIPHWLTERHDLSSADLLVAHAGELTVGRLARLVAEVRTQA